MCNAYWIASTNYIVSNWNDECACLNAHKAIIPNGCYLLIRWVISNRIARTLKAKTRRFLKNRLFGITQPFGNTPFYPMYDVHPICPQCLRNSNGCLWWVPWRHNQGCGAQHLRTSQLHGSRGSSGGLLQLLDMSLRRNSLQHRMQPGFTTIAPITRSKNGVGTHWPLTNGDGQYQLMDWWL